MSDVNVLPSLDFTEALKDSPRFRQAIVAHEQYFSKLDARLNELLNMLAATTEFGKSYQNCLYTLSTAITQLCHDFLPQDPSLLTAMKSLSNAFSQFVHLQKILIENSHNVIASSINSFQKNERLKVIETRTHFENLSSSLDEALTKRAAVHRARPADVADSRNALTAVGTCFAHTSLDYVAQISIAHSRKDVLILNALWSFANECASFFSRGHAFFDEWTAVESTAIPDTLAVLENKSRSVRRKMQDRHALVPKEVFLHPAGMSPDEDVVMEGYLFKRATNAFKTWHRRWFQIKDNKLIYSHRSDEAETPTVMESDLKLCLVRPAPTSFERTCCFELVTPTKSHLLQADSDTLCNAWMRALQRTIHYLHENDDNVLQATPGMYTDHGISLEREPSTLRKTLLTELRRIPGNDKCADCGAGLPKWASINLGILICIECCGIHRSFGVQVSKVRSVVMDELEPEQKKVMLALGNCAVNSIYLAHKPTTDVIPPPPNAHSTRPVRDAWIRAKYIERRFVRRGSERARSSALKRAEGGNRKIPSPHHISAKCATLSRCSSEPSSYLLLEQQRQQEQQQQQQQQWQYGVLDHDWIPESVQLKQQATLSNGDVRRISACGSDTNLALEQEKLVSSKMAEDAKAAAASGDILTLCRLIAEGVNINTVLDDTTVLHIAVEHNHRVAVEFLLLNGAKLNALDNSLNSPLHVAAKHARTLIVCQLVKRGADQNLLNGSGETPLDIAIEGKNADIVTLLRVQEMRNEFCDEFNNPMDETVDDVMLDISRKADPTL